VHTILHASTGDIVAVRVAVRVVVVIVCVNVLDTVLVELVSDEDVWVEVDDVTVTVVVVEVWVATQPLL